MGRQQFENQTLISAVTNKTISYLGEKHTSPLNYGQYDIIDIYSPKNTVSRIIGFNMYWDKCEQARATEKNIIVSLLELKEDGSLKGIVENLSIVGNDNVDLKLVYGEPENTVRFFPSDLGAFHEQLKGMVFDDSRCLRIAFFNNTGYSTSVRREFNMFVEREVIAR